MGGVLNRRPFFAAFPVGSLPERELGLVDFDEGVENASISRRIL